MSAAYRSIQLDFWKDPVIRRMGNFTKLVFIYLITNPNSDMTGLYRLSLGQIAFDLGVDVDTVKTATIELIGMDRIGYDEANEIVWVKNMFKYQVRKPSDTQLKHAKEQIESLGKCTLIGEFLDRYSDWYNALSIPLPKDPSVSKGLPGDPMDTPTIPPTGPTDTPTIPPAGGMDTPTMPPNGGMHAPSGSGAESGEGSGSGNRTGKRSRKKTGEGADIGKGGAGGKGEPSHLQHPQYLEKDIEEIVESFAQIVEKSSGSRPAELLRGSHHNEQCQALRDFIEKTQCTLDEVRVFVMNLAESKILMSLARLSNFVDEFKNPKTGNLQ